MFSLKRALAIAAGTLALTILTTLPDTATAQVRAALTRDMDSPIRGTRHFEQQQIIFQSGSFLENETLTPTIPAGKKWFVQSVSIHTLLTDGQSLMEASVSMAGSPRLFIDMNFQATAGGGASNPQRHFTGNRDLGILMSPGESISVRLFRNDNNGNSSLNFSNMTFSGYLVDANP